MQTKHFMIHSLSIHLFFIGFIREVIKKHYFKSFTGLTVQQFDHVYDKEIAKNITNMRCNARPKNIKKELCVLQRWTFLIRPKK